MYIGTAAFFVNFLPPTYTVCNRGHIHKATDVFAAGVFAGQDAE
jgi:hypothetical protein